MKEEHRTSIVQAMATLGVAGYRETTDPRRRPQWRASFSYHGEMEGETRYLQLFLPVDSDVVHIHCTVEAAEVDTMPQDRLKESLDSVAAEQQPGGSRWRAILDELGSSENDVPWWEAEMKPHTGLRHRMIVVRITMPLPHLTASSLALSARMGYRMAQDARAQLAAVWNSDQEAE